MQPTIFEPLMRIDTYSHFFRVTKMTPRMIGLLLRFTTRYVHVPLNSKEHSQKSPDPKIYAIKTKDDSEFRFHIGQLPEFLKMLEREFIEPHLYHIEDHTLYTPSKKSYKLRPEYVLRENQVEATDFIMDTDVSDFHTRLVTMPTGSGKGVVSLASSAKIGSRILVTVLSKYQQKWAIEIHEKLTVENKEIMMISGSAQLKGLILAAKENPKALPTFIIISITTLQNFYKLYEENPHGEEFLEYGIQPHELHEVLDVGAQIIDETHEQIYSVYKMMCYMHVPKLIALSGTVLSKDPFIERVHKMIYPKEIRFDKIKMEQYIKVYPISYVYRDFQMARVRTTDYGSNNYSQNAYEQFLLKRPQFLANYLKLIATLIEITYLKDYQPGDKLAVYAGRIEMCGVIRDYLKTRFPKLDIRRYAENDPYDNVINADIRCTTLLSAGTAIDIPGLTTVLMTNSVDSPVQNLQTLGRLRKIPGRDVKFVYMYCSEIPKQTQYHRNRLKLFEDRVASIKEYRAPIAI